MFVDRVAELDLLENRFASGQAELFVLYGRRWVGKTELLADRHLTAASSCRMQVFILHFVKLLSAI